MAERDDDEFDAVYGGWAGRAPADVAVLFDGYPGARWIAGGYAIEAFTGIERPHGDIDPGILRDDLPLLRRHLAGRLHVWAASSGSLTPLWPDDLPDAPADEVLPPGCGQVWTRPDATSPWEYDILLTPGTPVEWVYKRDPSIRLPMSRAVHRVDGLPYLRPEVQLLLKARGLRPKDQADFDVTAPLLGHHERAWLVESLLLSEGRDHPWVSLLR